MLGASKVDPETDERSYRIEHLPESHDLAADLSRREFANVDGAGGCKVILVSLNMQYSIRNSYLMQYPDQYQ